MDMISSIPEKGAVCIERTYGSCHARIYFAEEDVPDAGKLLLESLMHSYAERQKLPLIDDIGMINENKNAAF